MITGIFNSQSKTITFAAILLSGSALISRVLGLVRDMILADRFGAGSEVDVYFAAFRIPDFVFAILVMGGISAVFLPVFSETFNRNKEEAWRLVNNILNVFLVLLVVICSLLAVFTPWIVNIIAPGFDDAQKELAISLTRIMFLSPIFFGISSVFSGILHYFNRFIVYSLAPILYNLGIIFGIVFLYPYFGIHGLVYGVVLGAFLHWFIQIPAARILGYRYEFVLNFKQPELINLFKLMTPRSVGAVVFHINEIVMTAIASTLAIGSISIFTFAGNFQNIPVGIIGASFALASFPVLSKAWANGQKKEFIEGFSETFKIILFLVLPITVIFVLLNQQIVTLVLQRGNFGFAESQLTAIALGLFSVGIFAQTFMPFLARAFFSFQDTKTPFVLGSIAIASNIILSFLFVWLLSYTNGFQAAFLRIFNFADASRIAVVGLPLANSISGIMQFCLLLFFLRKKFNGFNLMGGIKKSFLKVLAASILMALSIVLLMKIMDFVIGSDNTMKIFLSVLFASLAGILVYVVTMICLKSSELQIIKQSIVKQFISGKK